MVRLIATSPCDGLLPVKVGDTILDEVTPDRVTLVSPLVGKKGAVDAALKAEIGVGLPAPNRTTHKDGVRAIWVGPGQALIVGASVSPEGAAVTDQSDAFAMISLEGTLAEAALARLCPIDLRQTQFKNGWTARTMLDLMTCSVTRTGRQAFEIMVFRSMAATAVHELSEALRRVAALEELIA